MEDAFPCGFCGETIGMGQFARYRQLENRKVVFFHPGCPRRLKSYHQLAKA